ncbi:MAG: type II toxin-antitoxin system RelE/ParE family toxin [Bacteroidota bacterium]|nr:type II toxin-antitoxin system RelE/ParE family toxin [Bacteroidota bacterium]
MSKQFVIRYLPIAQEDLTNILDWIVKDSPTRAISFVDKIDKRIGALAQSPLLGRIPRHPKLREYGYRVLILDSYLVFYMLHDKVIQIHRIVHASQNIDHLI